jgi:D-beta-D-heptose 7-phosphate kinase/D-beta-D-heptose 1-phosphate adenosyltransferase
LNDKVKDLKDLLKAIEVHREKGEKLVFTNGCYDLIHVGHIRFLTQCKNLGDRLILALNTDRSVKRLKGANRPIFPQDERTEIVSSFEVVDYVTVFDQDDPLEIIRAIKPDVLVKGGDWSLDTIIGRDVVESYGGRVLSLPLVAGYSTSRLISAITSRYKEMP